MFAFIHIEKTGGMTIHNWLRHQSLGYLTLRPYYYWSNEKGNYLTKRELQALMSLHPNLIGFGGHTVRHYLDYGELKQESFKYFTFLRSPIERYLSHFQYQKYVMKRILTFEEYLNESRFNNFMTVRLAQKHDAGAAIREIEDNIGFVGIMEYFNTSMLILCKYLDGVGLKPEYEKRNQGNLKDRCIFNELPKTIQEKILKNNEEDILLYNWVKEVKFPEYVLSYGDSLGQDLVMLERNLNGFRYSGLNRIFTKGIRIYTRYFSEPIAYTYK